MEAHDASTVVLQQGEAISINISSGGVQLLMPHAPQVQQVFEVYAPTPLGECTLLSLVEVRWTRRISRDSDESMCLVGLKVLLRVIEFGSTTGPTPTGAEGR